MTDLTYITLDTGEKSLNKTVTLVSGETECILIDAAFTRADGHRAVAAILDAGTRLTTVFISAGDPDYYFGAEVIHDAFPDVIFVAPSDVIGHIDHSYEAKLTAWAHLGVNLPTRRVEILPFESDQLYVDGVPLGLHSAEISPTDTRWYFFDPISRTIFGGLLTFGDLHVWTADTPTVESRAAWLRALDELESLDPLRVIAGHRAAGSADDSTSIRHTRDYLRKFESVIAEAHSGADAERELLAAYPTAGLKIAAHLGALVAKGEMKWG